MTSRHETPLSKFFELAKAKNCILLPNFSDGREGLLIESAGTAGMTIDREFQDALDLHREEAAAALWKQAKKITREFRAAVAAQGGEVKMVYRDGRPLILLAGGIDEQLAEHFEKHHYEINAVILAEGEPSGQVVKASELTQNQRRRKASNLTLAAAS